MCSDEVSIKRQDGFGVLGQHKNQELKTVQATEKSESKGFSGRFALCRQSFVLPVIKLLNFGKLTKYIWGLLLSSPSQNPNMPKRQSSFPNQ